MYKDDLISFILFLKQNLQNSNYSIPEKKCTKCPQIRKLILVWGFWGLKSMCCIHRADFCISKILLNSTWKKTKLIVVFCNENIIVSLYCSEGGRGNLWIHFQFYLESSQNNSYSLALVLSKKLNNNDIFNLHQGYQDLLKGVGGGT